MQKSVSSDSTLKANNVSKPDAKTVQSTPPMDDEFDEPIKQTAPTVIIAKHNTSKPETLRKYLAYVPVNVVKKTLEKTTQLAKAVTSFPLVRHVASRFAWMNRFRLREKVSTDTMFANTKAIGGAHCAQVFFGMTSQCINLYGMKSKADFPNAYKDFIHEQGIPTVLRRDGAGEENSDAVKAIQRKYLIKDEFS